jgi:hypothetical protein
MRRSGPLVPKAISEKLWMRMKNFFRNALVTCLLVAVLVILARFPIGAIASAQSDKESKSLQRQAFTDAVQQTPPKKPLLAELEVYADLGSVSADGVWMPDNPTKKNQLTEAVVKLECFCPNRSRFCVSGQKLFAMSGRWLSH